MEKVKSSLLAGLSKREVVQSLRERSNDVRRAVKQKKMKTMKETERMRDEEQRRKRG